MGISKIKRGALASGLAGTLLATAFGGVAQAQEHQQDPKLPRMGYTLRSETYKDKADGEVSPFIFTVPDTDTSKVYAPWGTGNWMYRTIPSDGRPEVIDEQKQEPNSGKDASIFNSNLLKASDLQESFKHLTYCFDQKKHFPNNAGRYAKSAESNEFAFTTPQTKQYDKNNQYEEPKSITNELHHKQAVTDVIWNGFPTDASNLREKLQLSVDQFHEATQQAVWKYTDEKTWSLDRAKQDMGNDAGLKSYAAYLALTKDQPKAHEDEVNKLLTHAPQLSKAPVHPTADLFVIKSKDSTNNKQDLLKAVFSDPKKPDVPFYPPTDSTPKKPECDCPKGDPGPAGPRGPQGAPGKDGQPGRNGHDGKPGKTGPQGPKGDPGPAGPRGPQGAPGKDGQPGRNGQDGAPGHNGKDGKDGVGILDIRIDNQGNLTITLTDGRELNLGKILGPRGPKGDKGDKGDPGQPGPKGDKGDKGDPGQLGPKGDKGDKGDPGQPGPKGDKGDKGDPGQPGPKGDKGDKGDPGQPGVPVPDTDKPKMKMPNSEVAPKVTPHVQGPSSKLPQTGATVGLLAFISTLMIGTGLLAHRARKAN